MEFTQEDVLQYVESEDVKFIRLAFCDEAGRQRNLAVMPGELKKAFCEGVAIGAGEIWGPGQGVVYLRPDPRTLLQMPWRPQHGRVVHLFCDLFTEEGEPFPKDYRGQLKALARGSALAVSAEAPFTLYKLDDHGHPTGEPHDQAGYLDIAPDDRGENIRRAVCLTLEEMGIQPESSHHGAAPGENLVRVRQAGLVEAADNLVTFQAVVRTLADQSGLYARFLSPPRLWVSGGGGRRELVPGEGWQNPYTLMAALARGDI